MTNPNTYTKDADVPCPQCGSEDVTEQGSQDERWLYCNACTGETTIDPPEEVEADYQSPQGFTGKRMGHAGNGAYSGLARGAGPQGKGQ